jgi:hypothetical protein
VRKLKLYEYLGLSEVEQYNTVWSEGVHVDTHIKDNIAINLYVINDFTLKCTMSIKTNKILYKQVFKQWAQLDKYLYKIEL